VVPAEITTIEARVLRYGVTVREKVVMVVAVGREKVEKRKVVTVVIIITVIQKRLLSV